MNEWINKRINYSIQITENLFNNEQIKKHLKSRCFTVSPLEVAYYTLLIRITANNPNSNIESIRSNGSAEHEQYKRNMGNTEAYFLILDRLVCYKDKRRNKFYFKNNPT